MRSKGICHHAITTLDAAITTPVTAGTSLYAAVTSVVPTGKTTSITDETDDTVVTTDVTAIDLVSTR